MTLEPRGAARPVRRRGERPGAARELGIFFEAQVIEIIEPFGRREKVDAKSVAGIMVVTEQSGEVRLLAQHAPVDGGGSLGRRLAGGGALANQLVIGLVAAHQGIN